MSKTKTHRFVDSTNWQEEHAELLEQLLDDTEEPENSIPAYEDQWSITRREPHCPKDRSVPSEQGENPVLIFRSYIERGLLPPPEILLVINSMLDTYFAHSGTRTLEEVFFGELKRGVGNYAARWSAEHDLIYSYFDMWVTLFGRKYSSDVKRAEAYLLEYEDRMNGKGIKVGLPEVDTFLRQVRRLPHRPFKSKTDN